MNTLPLAPSRAKSVLNFIHAPKELSKINSIPHNASIKTLRSLATDFYCSNMNRALDANAATCHMSVYPSKEQALESMHDKKQIGSKCIMLVKTLNNLSYAKSRAGELMTGIVSDLIAGNCEPYEVDRNKFISIIWEVEEIQ